MKCAECGKGPVEIRRENHKYVECGLDYVTLLNIEVRHCPECGQNEYVIPNIEALHRALATAIAEKQARLVPLEIRFLRKYLGYASKEFADAIGVAPATVSRWEGGATMTIGYERFLRMMVLNQKPVSYYPADRVEELGSKQAAPSKLRATAKNNGWEARAA
jgi:putative zinc finger/helix-turn-helix YgiT family protein